MVSRAFGYMLLMVTLLASVAQALTVEEVLLLKKNGVSEETIQMMIQSEMAAKQKLEKNPYTTMGIHRIERPDGKGAIVYSTGKGDPNRKAEERLREERAWEMLRHIIVDTRNTNTPTKP